MASLSRTLLALALLAVPPAAAAAEEPLPQTIEFNRDVRPILADNCFFCHGPDRAKRQANLRLDSADGATADLGGRRAVVAGDLEHSELWQRIPAEDEEPRLPPAKANRRLTPRQIDVLRRWVEQGAKYQK